MIPDEKDKKIASLRKSLAKARDVSKEWQDRYEMSQMSVTKLAETVEFQKKELTKCDQDIRNGEFREKNLHESVKHVEKERNQLMLDIAKWGLGKKEVAKEVEPQMEQAPADVVLARTNERLLAKLKSQHLIVRELAAFTQGVMLCELVDNPSQNNAYNVGSMKIGKMVEIADRLMLEE